MGAYLITKEGGNMQLVFEKVECVKNDGTPIGLLYRAKVPGGWIYRYRGQVEAMTFVPDFSDDDSIMREDESPAIRRIR